MGAGVPGADMQRGGIRGIVAAALWAAACLMDARGQAPPEVDGGQPEWIWSAPDRSGKAAAVVYFRRTFELGDPEVGRVEITADDAYELFVNGRRVGGGDRWRVLDVYDVTKFLVRGANTIAVRAENRDGESAGMVALVSVRQMGNTDVSHSSDGTWRVSTQEARNWAAPRFDDAAWKPATRIGQLGMTAPWNDDVKLADGTSPGRFRVPPGFRVERVAHPDQTGSIVAMTFNEQGQIVASVEGGPLVLVRDANGDGAPEAVSTYAEQVKNCQGILCLNGEVYAVGDGPDGTAFYRLTDKDFDGKIDECHTLLKFRGSMGEHGPHAPLLGPDGLIYIMIGNHAGVEVELSPNSPLKLFYEGDLFLPRYEDAHGHAAGIKVPGGIVVRTDVNAGKIELFCGGFRNAYDMAFDRYGELFTYDSDMEWDVGLPWYRPTRAIHGIAGGEYGWRSGWMNWPDYYVDSLPAVVDTGRGSPTGVEFYQHARFPVDYQGDLFLCDWSMGRIIAATLERDGASYRAKAETFVEGKPLNVTDVAVGPDGWLYFSTGGRRTEGGIYRVTHPGSKLREPEQGIAAALHQPQLQSAWARQRIALVKEKLGDAQWSRQLAAVANNPRFPADDRVRAMDLMQLIGPFPSPQFLATLSEDGSPLVRGKAAYLMGIHSNAATAQRLVALLDDPDHFVRRLACESIIRSKGTAPVEKLIEQFREEPDDAFLAWSARRVMETLPRESWESLTLSSDDPRVFVQGAIALLSLSTDEALCRDILANARQRLDEDLPPEQALNLVRICEVALHRGQLSGDVDPQLRQRLAAMYPSTDPRLNRELVSTLVCLQDPEIGARLIDQLAKLPDEQLAEKLHIAFQLRWLTAGWTLENKLKLLDFFENARTLPGGHSYAGYIDNATRDFVNACPETERREILLAHGAQTPAAALWALAAASGQFKPSDAPDLIELDRALSGSKLESARDLGVGLVAALAEMNDEAAMNYLREVFEAQPERRDTVAMGLAQQPGGANFPLLLRALPSLEGTAAEEVLRSLIEADEKPESAESYRQVILRGLKLKDDGARYANALLEKWSGEKQEAPADDWQANLAAWQKWFAEKHPDQPPAELPQSPGGHRSWDDLLAFINSDEGRRGNQEHGAAVFEKGKCVKCHKYGARGEGVGPDLSAVSRRFQRKEILESLLFPSQTISDQYAAKNVSTKDGRLFLGLVAQQPDGSVVVLQDTGEKITLKADNVEEIVPARKSAMPEGLLDDLTLEEIADLFAYLGDPPAELTAPQLNTDG